ncbi:MAG: methionyl aminopeptidase [Traorella sp.]
MIYSKNGMCWCGSKKKYKHCHYDFDEKLLQMKLQGYETPPKSIIRNQNDIKLIKESAKINTQVLDAVASQIHEGMSTQEIDDIVVEVTHAARAKCAPYHYEGYPKSVCTSINEVVCHGIPDKNRLLKSGDIINVDVSTIYRGYYSDASRMFMIGEVSDNARKLVEVTWQAVQAGLDAIKPWGTLGDVAHAIQSVAESNGYNVVRVFGGHGVGKEFHEEPFVSHVGMPNTGMVMAPGMTFTIEPMINEGTWDVDISEEDGWTVTTKDGKLSAQWEVMVLITETGYEILTQ